MAQADELPPKKSSKGKWIILLLVILLLGGGGFVAKQMGMLNKFFSGGSDSEKKPSSGEKQSDLNLATLPPLLVNLSDPMGRRYIKLTLQVEMISPEVQAELDKQSPRIRDAMIVLLSNKTYADLATPEGKLLLRNEILDRMNQILGDIKITRVFFTEFVME